MINNFIFDRNLKNISMNEWKDLYMNPCYVVLGRTQIGKYLISTIWTGISHAKTPFETIVFCDSNPYEGIRHKTEKESIDFHLELVKLYLSHQEHILGK